MALLFITSVVILLSAQLVIFIAAVVAIQIGFHFSVLQKDWVMSISIVLSMMIRLRMVLSTVVVVTHAGLVVENVTLLAQIHHLSRDRIVDHTVSLVDKLGQGSCVMCLL